MAACSNQNAQPNLDKNYNLVADFIHIVADLRNTMPEDIEATDHLMWLHRLKESVHDAEATLAKWSEEHDPARLAVLNAMHEALSDTREGVDTLLALDDDHSLPERSAFALIKLEDGREHLLEAATKICEPAGESTGSQWRLEQSPRRRKDILGHIAGVLKDEHTQADKNHPMEVWALMIVRSGYSGKPLFPSAGPALPEGQSLPMTSDAAEDPSMSNR